VENGLEVQMEMQHYKRVLDGVEWSVACAALEATKRKSTQVKVKLLKAKSHTAKCEQVRKKMFFSSHHVPV